MEKCNRIMLKSKIHHIHVSDTHPSYVGSIFIDGDLLEKANISKFEKVEVINIDNGARWETYAVPTEKGSGYVSVRGGGARLCVPGDTLIILSYTMTENTTVDPKMVLADKNNKFKEFIHID
ncbi:MAG: aspartate 1-decarboxylase [Sphaerochaetaceae bacterium]|nr:aspartate 1-decarboxylase [Sphaerochaetaceae bacterium]